MRSKCKKNTFTLVEVLVGMAILSILMMLLLQFFTGAQKIWSSTESKNSLYANSRVAMNLMSNLIQSAYYVEGESMFRTDMATADKGKIYFSVRSPIRPRGTTNLYYASFQRNNNNQLIFGAYCDKNDSGGDTDFWTTVLAFNGNPSGTTTTIVNKLDTDVAKADPSMIIPNVVSLKFRIAHIDYTTNTTTWVDSGTYDRFPVAVEITLSLLSDGDYLKWNELQTNGNADIAKAFLNENQQTFTRIVFLGDKNKI